MLDSHYYRHESKVVAVTKETEKTISPDKVTEMYDAVREQALKDIVASLRVEENILNGIVVQFASKTAVRDVVPCPRCGSHDTTETSHFGSTACKSLYKCLSCLEPFDYFKPY